jgi:hypothetical protein
MNERNYVAEFARTPAASRAPAEIRGGAVWAKQAMAFGQLARLGALDLSIVD